MTFFSLNMCDKCSSTSFCDPCISIITKKTCKTFEPRKKTSYFPLHPGCLIGILVSWYEIISGYNWVGFHPLPKKNQRAHVFTAQSLNFRSRQWRRWKFLRCFDGKLRVLVEEIPNHFPQPMGLTHSPYNHKGPRLPSRELYNISHQTGSWENDRLKSAKRLVWDNVFIFRRAISWGRNEWHWVPSRDVLRFWNYDSKGWSVHVVIFAI